MRVTVVGATSRTGHHLLAEGVRRGHEVVAATRRANTLSGPGPEDSASVRMAINVSGGAHGAAA